MVFLASSLTQVLIAATLVLAVALGGAVAYFYAQARRREAFEAEREAHQHRLRDAELTHIRQRLEEIYERQQTGAETQFARVNQELEDLQLHLDAKGRQIDGVQGQLRHELKRHEEEIAALRNQLREAIEVFAAAALPAARPAPPALNAPPSDVGDAMQPAEVAAKPPAPAPPTEPPAFTPITELLKDDNELLDDMFGGTALDSEAEPDEDEEPVAAPISDRGFTAHSIVGASDLEASDDEFIDDDFEFIDLDAAPFAPKETAPEPAPSETIADGVEAWSFEEVNLDAEDAAETMPPLPSHSGDGMSDESEIDTDDFAAPAHPEPAFGPEDAAFDVVELDSEAPARTNLDADETPGDDSEEIAPAELSEAFDAAELLAPDEPETDALPLDDEPTGYEDLTLLSAVDEAMQQKLYALGITTIESIARWSRADARRIATHLTRTNEEDIMDHWVFEAQSLLFERYQDELREQRLARAD